MFTWLSCTVFNAKYFDIIEKHLQPTSVLYLFFMIQFKKLYQAIITYYENNWCFFFCLKIDNNNFAKMINCMHLKTRSNNYKLSEVLFIYSLQKQINFISQLLTVSITFNVNLLHYKNNSKEIIFQLMLVPTVNLNAKKLCKIKRFTSFLLFNC